MTIPQAAEKLNLSPQLLRIWIQKGTCPFGYVVNESKQHRAYYINEERMKLWIEGRV